jgi:hypothetical protein
MAFFIALIPTLNNQWPLTLDIFVHIHNAELYSQYGLVFIDPLINPPGGTPIIYPPLFSLLLMFLHTILKIDYFQVARILQPFLAFFSVLSLSYVAKKFYGDVAGISAGFMLLSSYLFTRLVSPLPETLALIFVPLVVYLYYQSVMTKKYKYALLSSFLFLLVIFTHQATTLLLFLIITSITLVVGIIKREKHFLTSYALFLSLPLIAAVIMYITALLIAPNFANKILTLVQGYTASLPFSVPISVGKYLVYLGIVLIFVIAGSVVAIKRRKTKDLFVIVWIIIIFIMSISYLFGVNVYTLRVLIHLLLPLSILGGLGLSYLYLDYKKTEFPSKSIRSIFIISIFIISTLFAITTVTETNFEVIPNYNSQPFGSTEMIIPQIAPPTNSDADLAVWFNKFGDKKSAIVSNNYATNQFLLAVTGQPIADVLSSEHVIEWGFGSQELAKKDVGYFVFDKRLNFSSEPNKIISHGAFIYFNKNYNITSLLPNNAKLLYENMNYMVFKI